MDLFGVIKAHEGDGTSVDGDRTLTRQDVHRCLSFFCRHHHIRKGASYQAIRNAEYLKIE
jgi:hypothetical protein